MNAAILNLNKPSGMSSRQAVDCVKRLVKPAKVGHAGTLDPLASGALVVCIGKATRLIEFVQRMPKRYVATFLLARTSPTEDIEGEISEIVGAPIPSREQIERACANFVGTIQQRPPAFSALKVAGKRAYELARRGHAVELEPRSITVHGLQLVEYEYPRLVLDVQCSAGTYVRSLGRDLAESLGTGAVMSELVRTEIGPFHVERAMNPRDMTMSTLAEAAQPPQAALAGLEQIVLDSHELDAIAHGRFVKRPTMNVDAPSNAEVVALDQQGALVAVLRRRDDGALAPYINFVGK
jgi:tRNA pseudouridine55 synthase